MKRKISLAVALALSHFHRLKLFDLVMVMEASVSHAAISFKETDKCLSTQKTPNLSRFT